MTRDSGSPLIHLYTTKGEFTALLAFPFLYNRDGDWIGWVSDDREVYNLEGEYVGWVSGDRRILRRRSVERRLPFPLEPPAPDQLRLRPPANVPLPPLMAEYSRDVVDVFEEMPELLHTLDHGELRPDME